MDHPSPSTANVEQAVRDYLRLHPHALDTERGIREWWLQNLEPRASAATVRAAIESLLASREISRLALPDGQVVYAIGRRAAAHPRGRP